MTLRDPRPRAEHPAPRASVRDRRSGLRLGGSGLRPLREIEDEFEVADGYPDIRGWIVSAKGGTIVGSVADLIVDPESLLARYMLVALGPQGTDEEIGRRVLVPMTEVVLHGPTDEARVPSLTAPELAELPPYSRAMLTRDDDAGLLRRIGVRAVLARDDDAGLLRRIGVRAVLADAERPVEVHPAPDAARDEPAVPTEPEHPGGEATERH